MPNFQIITSNMPKLIISGTTYELVDDLITIGRGPDNTIIINNPSVSARHAHLQLAGETYRLKDLGSTNGTHVNGKPVTETLLSFDDRIRFGAGFGCERIATASPARGDQSKTSRTERRPCGFYQCFSVPAPKTTERPTSQWNFYRL